MRPFLVASWALKPQLSHLWWADVKKGYELRSLSFTRWVRGWCIVETQAMVLLQRFAITWLWRSAWQGWQKHWHWDSNLALTLARSPIFSTRPQPVAGAVKLTIRFQASCPQSLHRVITKEDSPRNCWRKIWGWRWLLLRNRERQFLWEPKYSKCTMSSAKRGTAA